MKYVEMIEFFSGIWYNFLDFIFLKSGTGLFDILGKIKKEVIGLEASTELNFDAFYNEYYSQVYIVTR